MTLPHPHLRKPMAIPRQHGPTWDQVLVAAVAILMMFGCFAGFVLFG